jgi:hypothetical protein
MRVRETMALLTELGLGPKQRNEIAAYTLLGLLDLEPTASFCTAAAPLRGITPIIEFVWKKYGKRYAANTRETIRDDVVKPLVAEGLLLRNPDDPARPTNSGKTVYQIDPAALGLFRQYGTPVWPLSLRAFLDNLQTRRSEMSRGRNLVRVPISLPGGAEVFLSPGGQNPLIKAVLEVFCPAFTPSGKVLYIGDAENKLTSVNQEGLAAVGIHIRPADKVPDVIVHDTQKNWLLLIEAVTTAGPVDGKRRLELRNLFESCTAGLVFVTAFANRQTMRRFVAQIGWETEVWIADDPDHMIHFDGAKFLGPYEDAMPVARVRF